MRLRSALVWLSLLAASIAVLPQLGSSRSAGGGRGSGDARVTRVVDGDTIKVDMGGVPDTVRYIGMDTPESVKPGVPVQCDAERASHRNAQLVAGRRVRLVVGAEPRDRYGRLLAYVYRRDDGQLVNEELLREGLARTLTIPPNDRLAARFARVQAAARAAGRGLWSQC